MANIKKTDMKARALVAAETTPSISDRFAHARKLGGASPVVYPEASQHTMDADTDKSGLVKVNSALGPGYLEEIALELIDENPFNARRVYRASRIKEMATSIGANGQDTPGIATIRNGRYVLVAGHYRYKALQMLRNRPMLLIVRPDLSDKQMYEMSFRENEEREDQSGLDNALAWKVLIDQGVYSNESDLAIATGYSVPNINKTLAILRLDESILEIIREEPTKFKFSVVYELVLFAEVAKLERIDETIALTRGILDGTTTRKMLQDAREKLGKIPTKRKPKETARTYRIDTNSNDSGSLKTWDSGKISLDVTIPDSTERQKLIAYLQARFGLSD